MGDGVGGDEPPPEPVPVGQPFPLYKEETRGSPGYRG